jgi:YfiH family protein
MVVDGPWSWLRQVHGDTVVTVAAPGEGAGAKADAVVTADEACVLAVLAADCAPVALATAEGIVATVHAGWRGLVAGVVERTVERVRSLGGGEVHAALGPCIHAECYEFGTVDLDLVAARLGDSVRSTSRDGTPALDVPAAVRAALAVAGVRDLHDVDICTSCSDDYFSWRRRAEQARQALVVWR